VIVASDGTRARLVLFIEPVRQRVGRFDVSRTQSDRLGIMHQDERAIEEAARAGFDLSLIDANLALTHEERARQHDRALALVLEFDQIRHARDAKSKPRK